MKLTEKQLLLEWVTNQKLRLSEEYLELLRRIRYQRSDLIDYLEMIVIQQRINDFDEFASDMIKLLNLDI